jgi:TPR repeat protein
MYRNGYGVDQDDAEAVKWYRKAAEQDHAFAQSNLGLMYANGLGVEQDYIQAYKWMLLAGVNGHYDAPVINLLEANMKPHEMDEARRLANEHIEQKKQKESSPK